MTVEKWFNSNQYHYKSYSNIKKLTALKKTKKLKITVLIPVLNEGKTIGKICKIIKNSLMKKHAFVDELIVMDSGSTDDTEKEVKENGAEFVKAEDILKKYKNFKGKGENIWKGLYVSTGDIIVVLDGDIKNFQTRFITGVVGPMLCHKKIKYVNSYFKRPFIKGETVTENAGGRLTGLLIKPLFNQFFPGLRGFIQPLGGAYAVKRVMLEKIPLFVGYTGDVIIPIDIQRMFGLASMAQVNLGRIIHDHQNLSSLSDKSFGILNTVMKRVSLKGKLVMIDQTNKYVSIQSKKIGNDVEYSFKKKKFYEKERPPMITINEYRKKFKKGEFREVRLK